MTPPVSLPLVGAGAKAGPCESSHWPPLPDGPNDHAAIDAVIEAWKAYLIVQLGRIPPETEERLTIVAQMAKDTACSDQHRRWIMSDPATLSFEQGKLKCWSIAAYRCHKEGKPQPRPPRGLFR